MVSMGTITTQAPLYKVHQIEESGKPREPLVTLIKVNLSRCYRTRSLLAHCSLCSVVGLDRDISCQMSLESHGKAAFPKLTIQTCVVQWGYIVV